MSSGYFESGVEPMSTVPLPLPQYYPRHQEDLYWYKFESDGALGRKSIQGAIQARLEGSAGCFGDFDLETNGGLDAAIKDVTGRASFRAAGRIKRIEKAFKRVAECTDWKHHRCSPQNALSAIYWTPPQQGLEAFESFANLVVFSGLAHQKFRQAKTKLSFVEWITILSQRRLGYYDLKSRQRSKPKATNGEISVCIGIKRECEILCRDALWQYVKAVRKNYAS